MAFPTAVNDQVTDAATESNVKVLGDAPAQALATLYQATAQSLATAAQNAVSNQQQAGMLANAVLSRATSSLVGSPDTRK